MRRWITTEPEALWMRWSERQRAMLREMGLPPFWPVEAEVVEASQEHATPDRVDVAPVVAPVAAAEARRPCLRQRSPQIAWRRRARHPRSLNPGCCRVAGRHATSGAACRSGVHGLACPA